MSVTSTCARIRASRIGALVLRGPSVPQPSSHATRHGSSHAIETTLDELGHLDIVVSNAAFQQRVKDLEHLTVEQIERRTSRTNILGCMFLTARGAPALEQGGSDRDHGIGGRDLREPEPPRLRRDQRRDHADTRSLASALISRGERCRFELHHRPGPSATRRCERLRAYGAAS